MVNPGGTGRPRLVISARLAPLPPSRSLRSLWPSVKSYTNLDTVYSCDSAALNRRRLETLRCHFKHPGRDRKPDRLLPELDAVRRAVDPGAGRERDEGRRGQERDD